jgi:pilus assembly protein CpaF
MGGFLKSLQKKGPQRGSLEHDIIVHTRAADARATEVEVTSQALGNSETLLSDLKAEARSIEKQSIQATGSDPFATKPTTGRFDRSRVKLLTPKGSEKNRSSILSDALPYWLTDPRRSSPQVDQLVPKARDTLNEILNQEVSQAELPLYARKAVNIAAGRLANEIRISTRDIEESIDELLGLLSGKGPLQPLYDDPFVTDIFIDSFSSIKCIRRGEALETPFRFRSADEYDAYLTGMLHSVDRVLNVSSPIVDVVLDDPWRSRVNAIHSSLLDGKESAVVVRVPRLQEVTFFDLLQTRTLPAPVAAWLTELVACGSANILVIGPTGSGKTVLTTALLSAVGSNERVCTIEDVPEIFVPTSHLEKLVARPANSQGEGAIGIDQLLRAALRRAPHRIVVGEIRDREGSLFLRALETGHAGSVATIHSGKPKEALWRLLDVVAAYENSPQESIQRRISRSVSIVICMKRIEGRPCLVEIAEVHPPVNGDFIVQQLITFDGEEDGHRIWRLMTTSSNWIDQLAERGMYLQVGGDLLPIDPSQTKNEHYTR